MTARPLYLFLACALLGASLVAQAPLDIDVWYGNSQSFGGRGHPQRWVNILGNVQGTTATTTLWASVNGAPERPLSLGPDQRRLAQLGDFNVDIDVADLVQGANAVVLRANDGAGVDVFETVTVNFEESAIAPQSVFIDWSTVTNLQDVVQVVDGHWMITPQGLRTSQIAYDRVFAVGDLEWTDFEIIVPFTVHYVDPAGFNSISGRPAIGICARWTGHYPYRGSGEQPFVDWRSYGGGPWHEFSPNQRLQLIGWDGMTVSDPSRRAIPLGVTHYWKLRCESLADGDSWYGMKMWQSGAAEPANWELIGREGVADLARGGAIFVAHHVDATFGNISIRGLAGDIEPPQLSEVTAIPYADSITVTWQADEPSVGRVDFGQTAAFELGGAPSDGQSLAHRVRLDGLSPGVTYRLRPVASDRRGNLALGDELIVTTLASPQPQLASDDFSSGLSPVWRVRDSFGTQFVDVSGGQMRIHLPGDRDRIGLDATQVMRPARDEDLEIAIEFASPLDGAFLMQGIVVEQDADNAIFAELSRAHQRTRAYVRVLRGGEVTTPIALTLSETDLPIAAAPLWVRLTRRVNSWTLGVSLDEQVWRTIGTCEATLAPTQVGILAGNQYDPHTIIVDSFDVTPVDMVPPQISGIRVAAAGTRASVTWNTDEPCTSALAWGAYSASENHVGSSLLRTKHFLQIDGLAPESEFRFVVTSTDSAGNVTNSTEYAAVTSVLTNSTGLKSDAFDQGPVDGSVWEFISPKSGANIDINNGELILSSSGSLRDLWSNEYSVPRLLQPVVDDDFTLVTRFDSSVSGNWQSQGVVFEQDDTGDFLRAEFLSFRDRPHLFVASVQGGKATTHLSLRLPGLPTPQWMRVHRSGDRWGIGWSADGVSYVGATELFLPLRLRRIGPYVGHSEGFAHTARVEAFVNVAVPPPDLRPPAIDSLSVAANDSRALVRWVTDEPATSMVEFGLSPTYGFSVQSPVLTFTHEIALPVLQAGTDYHFRVRSADASENTASTGDSVFRTALAGNVSGLRSDAFDGSASQADWKLVDPSGDAVVVYDGGAAEIRLSGATTHDAWRGANGFARLVQAVFDEDFVAQVTFASSLTSSVQIQGLLAESDEDTLLRAEFHRVNSRTRVFVATIDDGVPTVRASIGIPLSAPMSMRVSRAGDAWVIEYSLDAENWTAAANFEWQANITAVGPFAGNSAGSPFTARIVSFTSGGDPLPDVTAPAQTNIRVAAAAERLVVRWQTDEPALGVVEVGQTAGYGVTHYGAGLTQHHEVVVPGLPAETVHHLRVSSADSSGNRTIGGDQTVVTAIAGNSSGLRSDTFDSLDPALWSIHDPLGDASIALSGTAAGELLIAIPAGVNHELWANVDTAPRVFQDVVDADCGVEVRFGSLPTESVQAQGLVFREGPGRGLRVEILSTTSLSLFVGYVDGASSAVLAMVNVPPGTDPSRLRVDRAGDLWSVSLGDGQGGWTPVAGAVQPMVVRQVGVSIGNTATTSHSAVFEEFVSVAQPLPDLVPPIASGLRIAAGDDAVLVRWTTDEPTIGRVQWGLSSTLGSFAYSNGGSLSTEHEVILAPITPLTTVFHRLFCSDASGNDLVTELSSLTAATVGFKSGAVADEFDQMTLGAQWIAKNPRAAADIAMTGTAVRLSLPSGIAHDAWTSGIQVPRIVQPVLDRDIDVAARFETASTADLVMHGLCLETSAGGFLRIEFLNRESSGEYLFVTYVEGTSYTIYANRKIGTTSAAPHTIRLRRTGDSFEVLRSMDGTSWIPEVSFSASMSIRNVGIYAGNPSGNSHAVEVGSFTIRSTL